MRREEAIVHERETVHRRRREEPEVCQGAIVSDWGDPSAEDGGWGDKSGLGALDNRKFEGSIVTMPTRVASWMRGVALASKGGDGGWRMEDDYQVEEYPPLDEWAQGWGETWAMSSTTSSVGVAPAAVRLAIGQGGLHISGNKACLPMETADVQFLTKVDRLKQPSHRLQTRWVEFRQLSTPEKIERIHSLVNEIRGPFH